MGGDERALNMRSALLARGLVLRDRDEMAARRHICWGIFDLQSSRRAAGVPLERRSLPGAFNYIRNIIRVVRVYCNSCYSQSVFYVPNVSQSNNGINSQSHKVFCQLPVLGTYNTASNPTNPAIAPPITGTFVATAIPLELDDALGATLALALDSTAEAEEEADEAADEAAEIDEDAAAVADWWSKSALRIRTTSWMTMRKCA